MYCLGEERGGGGGEMVYLSVISVNTKPAAQIQLTNTLPSAKITNPARQSPIIEAGNHISDIRLKLFYPPIPFSHTKQEKTNTHTLTHKKGLEWPVTKFRNVTKTVLEFHSGKSGHQLWESLRDRQTIRNLIDRQSDHSKSWYYRPAISSVVIRHFFFVQQTFGITVSPSTLK